MKILITGGGGFVGGKLARRLASDGTLDGQRITELILTDIIEPALPNASFEVRAITADLANPEMAPALLSDGVDVIYHLACVASGGSEADFDLGMAANLHQQDTGSIVQIVSSLAVRDPMQNQEIHAVPAPPHARLAAPELTVNR